MTPSLRLDDENRRASQARGCAANTTPGTSTLRREVTPARALATLVLAATTTIALADRSRLDDESDVVDRGDCELELAVERTRATGCAPNAGAR